MKKLRLLPPFVTFLAGAITSVSAYILHYSMKKTLLVLFIVLVVFYVLGVFAMKTIENAPGQKKKEVSEDGEVIEKDTEGENSTEEINK